MSGKRPKLPLPKRKRDYEGEHFQVKISKRVKALNKSDREPTEEELREAELKWAPKLPIIAMFFRWCTRGPRHFNSESISIIHTIAQQCNMDPVDLLQKMRIFYFVAATDKNKCGPFGFLVFYAITPEGDPGYDPDIQQSIHLLKVAYLYLERSMVVEKGICGKVGYRKTANQTNTVGYSMKGGKDIQIVPVAKSYVPEYFEGRIQKITEHRTLAFEVITYILKFHINKAVFITQQHSILTFSYQVLAPCKERRDFVTVLAYLCMRCPNAAEIRAQEIFKQAWEERHSNPLLIYQYAFNSLNAVEPYEYINSIFAFFRAHNRNRSVCKYKNAEEEEFYWKTIQAQVFRHWLSFHAQQDLRMRLSVVTHGNKKPPPPSPDNLVLENTVHTVEHVEGPGAYSDLYPDAAVSSSDLISFEEFTSGKKDSPCYEGSSDDESQPSGSAVPSVRKGSKGRDSVKGSVSTGTGSNISKGGKDGDADNGRSTGSAAGSKGSKDGDNDNNRSTRSAAGSKESNDGDNNNGKSTCSAAGSKESKDGDDDDNRSTGSAASIKGSKDGDEDDDGSTGSAAGSKGSKDGDDDDDGSTGSAASSKGSNDGE